MPEVNGLSRAFVESHAPEAARALEGLPVQDTAQFFAALPARLAATVVRHMSPPYCAKVFEQLGDEQATGLFRVVGPQVAAQIIQQFAQDRQGRLLAQLPVGAAVAIRLLVGYPAGTCGASMNPWPLALTPDTHAAEALEQVRRYEGEIGDCVFVTDEQRRLRGVVGLHALVRAERGRELSAIMGAPHHFLSALATATTAVRHPGWDEYHVLPVVEREDRLVGALHRHALVTMLESKPSGPAPDVAGGAAGVYWQTVSLLTEIVVGALPPVSPVERAGRNDER